MADTPPTTPPTTPPAKKRTGMRDMARMMNHAFATRGPVGGKAAMLGVPYMQRSGGNPQYINPKAEWEQQQMLEDYRARKKAAAEPKPDVPLPPLNPNTPQAAVGPSMADTVVPQKAAITPYSKQSGFGTVGFGAGSKSRKVNGGRSGGGAGGSGGFGGMF